MNRILALALLLLVLPGLARADGAPERPDYASRSRVTMDYFSTASTLQLFDDFSDPDRVAAFEDTWADVQALLARIDAALSLSDPESDVSRFNALEAGESMEISGDTAGVLEAAGAVYAMTGGAYDPTVAPLVDLFGFTPRFASRQYRPRLAYDRPMTGGVLPLPGAETVSALRALVDYGGIRIDGRTIAKTAPAVEVGGETFRQSMDLGGIGKGYAVDRVLALLRERGYEYGYFSCGGSSIGILSRATASKGAPEPAQWGVGVQYPRFTDTQEVLLRVFTRDSCLSTSGDYEHAYVLDGVRYCHLIDPATGWPVNMPEGGAQSGVCSMTVLGENAALCDALSTALCVMGPEAAVAFMNRPGMDGYQYLMILYADGSECCEIVTDMPPGQYELLDEARFRIASATDKDGRVVYTGNLAAKGGGPASG